MTCPEATKERGASVATAYATSLLSGLEGPLPALDRPADVDISPPTGWARSGAMALTGTADGPPRTAPAPVAACADGAAQALTALALATTGRAPDPLDGAALLGERAALADPRLQRAGSRAPGGSCRMIRCLDGWLALNLARPEDVELLPAWLARDAATSAGAALDDPWTLVEADARDRRRDDLVTRGRLMGMAVAPVREREVPVREQLPPAPGRWHRVEATSPGPFSQTFAQTFPGPDPPLVVDLSSLWAGPLCGQLLADCGMRVVKVESTERPDGARRGEAAFFDLMNGMKESVALPFRRADGRRVLAELLARADIVIESSRRRALEQLGISARDFVQEHGVTWIAITGYGRSEPEASWVAFGDDAAAAADLVTWDDDGTPLFCGDAIADPLAGLHAAVAALGSMNAGGGRLVDLSLHGVAAHVRSFGGDREAPQASVEEPIRPPRARPVRRRASKLGADGPRVLRELGIEC